MEEEYAKLKRNEILAAAVISLACRLEGYPRTLQEISNATNLDIHSISKAQTAIARDLKISTGRVSPQDLVGRIISNPLIRMTDPVTIQYAKVPTPLTCPFTPTQQSWTMRVLLACYLFAYKLFYNDSDITKTIQISF
jgi:Transcription factor TFIIB repeat